MNYRAIPKPGRSFRHPVKNAVVRLKTTTPKKPVKITPSTIKTRKSAPVIQHAPTPAPLNTPAPKKSIHISKAKPSRAARAKTTIQTPKKNSSMRSRSVSSAVAPNNFRNEILGLKGKGAGRILVILANGPSILEAQIEKLKGHSIIDIMCINKPDMRVWPTKYWAFSDQSQYNRHKDLFDSFPNTIVNSTAVKARKGRGQIVVRGLNGQGFSRDLLRGFHIGRSTVYASMQTALWMEYDKCFIFGIDMCKVDGKLWWYGENPDVKAEVREERFNKEAENYERAFKILKAEEKIFTMCSAYNPWPFAEKFGKMNHIEAVQHIINLANDKLTDRTRIIK